MKHGSLFNGLGGFQLAAEMMGWKNVMSCEIDPFCNKVTGYYWPQCKQYGDIRNTDFTIYRGKIDILSGGFPCQPYSTAGKRLGKEDDRHLWPEMLRAIREIKPTYVVGENVRGLINWNGGLVFHEVQSDLEVEGYEVQPFLLPACGINAPHRRDRIWFVAYSSRNGGRQETKGGLDITRELFQEPGRQENTEFNQCTSQSRTSTNSPGDRRERKGKRVKEKNRQPGFFKNRELERGLKGLRRNGTSTNSDKFNGNVSGLCTGELPQQPATGIREDINAYSESRGLQREQKETEGKFRFNGNPWNQFPTQSPVCSRNDGFPSGLDGITFSKWRSESIKGYGNAIVPQVALQIFKAIEKSI